MTTQEGVMKFEAIKKETVMLNPQKDMAERRISSEIRIDPLTGRTARICHFMKLQWQKTDFDALVAGTDAWCPFCEERVLEVTPSYPKDLTPEGSMKKTTWCLSEHRPLRQHRGRGDVRRPLFYSHDGVRAGAHGRRIRFSQDFFKRIESTGHPESVYHIINRNYMPPAGSSLIHLHLQVFSTSWHPTSCGRN
jgi:UDPglucose--hexose-1-phosphate uridylyltransferase